MGRQDLSKLRDGLKRCMEIEGILNSRKELDALLNKLPEMEDKVKALNSQIKEQERVVKPLRKKKQKADSRVERAKKSPIYFDTDSERETQLGFFIGLFLALSIFAIMEWLDNSDTIDLYDDDGDLQDGFITDIYYFSICFSCCVVPFMGGFFISAFPSIFDPAKVATELQILAEHELQSEESALGISMRKMNSLKGEISRAKQDIGDIEKGVEKADLDRDISELRSELKENYAKISHLVPFSYMLDE